MLKINNKSKLLSIAISCIAISTATISIAHDNKAAIVVSKGYHKAHSSNPNSELMIRAIRHNDLNKVRSLLNNGVGINENLEGDGTPLIIAVQRNKIELVQALIDLGADVNQATDIDGNALINAAMKNNVEIAKLLLDQGANLDAIVINDETALITASRAGHFEMVKFLVERGADVNLGVQVKLVKGTEYRSPLNGARNMKITQYLENNGAKA
ncbi:MULTISPECIES: ankyrin repeat domain-containing protein [unclassified Pseudoalteromonas]|uniref:ankyrin repeat domain-containing protein n=1 Tax=unclassified Pseudoalteromonas TaxID=194690 RepID=UPI000694637E|nr:MULTISPECIES: ankyrin repeat domain-containing protein [unclassified Pseudoalteromonas]